MATHRIQKSLAHPEKSMEGDAIALMSLKCLREKPALFEKYLDDFQVGMSATNAAWDDMMKFPHTEGDDKLRWLSCPIICIVSHEKSRVSIHQVTLTYRHVSKDGDVERMFLIEDNLGLNVFHPDEIKVDSDGDDIFVVTDALDYVFSDSDPSWPWPLLYPERFAGLIQLGKMIVEKKDTNPLTGLCRASDGAYRSLAKMVAAEIKLAYDQIARDIVAAI
jgi:hypothetical protein